MQSYESISNCIDNALNHWGKLDILINNAGVGSATVSSFAESNEAQDTAMININADGTLKMCQKYIEVMNKNNQKNTLKIINLSSVGGGISINQKVIRGRNSISGEWGHIVLPGRTEEEKNNATSWLTNQKYML